MPVDEARVFLKLDELLTQKVIDQRIEVFTTMNYWYKHSYPVFKKRFDKTREMESAEAWVERTTLIYSWLPTIPLNSFVLREDKLDEAKKRLTELESVFFDADLSTIGKSIYSTRLGREESIFPSYKSHPALAIRDFLKPASELIHIAFNQNTQLSSTTKLLHFMCPELFPIFDRKVCIVCLVLLIKHISVTMNSYLVFSGI